MYERIILATDDSEHAEAAARHAMDLAEVHGATVHASFSWRRTPTGPPSRRAGYPTAWEVGRDRGHRALEAVERLATDSGVPVGAELLEGTVEAEPVVYAETAGMDLVMMGTHGCEGVGGRLLGSVAERVVREAPGRMVTVNPSDDR